MLSRSRLKELLMYDPTTGLFTWMVNRGPRRIGDVCHTRNSEGYHVIRLDGTLYYAHRLAFLYVLGYMPDYVDHKDGVPGNDEWDNLREATQSQNIQNTRGRSDNTTGHRGVTRDKNTFTGRVQVRGNVHRRCGFPTVEAAAEWCRTKREELHGEYRRTVA